MRTEEKPTFTDIVHDLEQLAGDTTILGKSKKKAQIKEKCVELQRIHQTEVKSKEEAQANNEYLIANNTQLIEESQLLRTNNTRLKENVTKLEEDYKNYQDANRTLRTDKASLESQNQTLFVEKKDVEAKLQQSEKARGDLELAFIIGKSEGERSFTENVRLKKQLEGLKQVIGQYTSLGVTLPVEIQSQVPSVLSYDEDYLTVLALVRVHLNRLGLLAPGHFNDVLPRQPLLFEQPFDAGEFLETKLMPGAAYEKCDSFFDAIAQALEDKKIKIPGDSQYPAHKRLRLACRDYLYGLEEKPDEENWVKTTFLRMGLGEDDYQSMLNHIEYTQSNQAASREVWGRPAIEGRIVCHFFSQQLKQPLQLHIIELSVTDEENNGLEAKPTLATTHWQVAPDGYRQMNGDSVDETSPSVLHLVHHQGHYVPLLSHPTPTASWSDSADSIRQHLNDVDREKPLFVVKFEREGFHLCVTHYYLEGTEWGELNDYPERILDFANASKTGEVVPVIQMDGHFQALLPRPPTHSEELTWREKTIQWCRSLRNPVIFLNVLSTGLDTYARGLLNVAQLDGNCELPEIRVHVAAMMAWALFAAVPKAHYGWQRFERMTDVVSFVGWRQAFLPPTWHWTDKGALIFAVVPTAIIDGIITGSAAYRIFSGAHYVTGAYVAAVVFGFPDASEFVVVEGWALREEFKRALGVVERDIWNENYSGLVGYSGRAKQAGVLLTFGTVNLVTFLGTLSWACVAANDILKILGHVFSRTASVSFTGMLSFPYFLSTYALVGGELKERIYEAIFHFSSHCQIAEFRCQLSRKLILSFLLRTIFSLAFTVLDGNTTYVGTKNLMHELFSHSHLSNTTLGNSTFSFNSMAPLVDTTYIGAGSALSEFLFHSQNNTMASFDCYHIGSKAIRALIIASAAIFGMSSLALYGFPFIRDGLGLKNRGHEHQDDMRQKPIMTLRDIFCDYLTVLPLASIKIISDLVGWTALSDTTPFWATSILFFGIHLFKTWRYHHIANFSFNPLNFSCFAHFFGKSDQYTIRLRKIPPTAQEILADKQTISISLVETHRGRFPCYYVYDRALADRAAISFLRRNPHALHALKTLLQQAGNPDFEELPQEHRRAIRNEINANLYLGVPHIIKSLIYSVCAALLSDECLHRVEAFIDPDTDTKVGIVLFVSSLLNGVLLTILLNLTTQSVGIEKSRNETFKFPIKFDRAGENVSRGGVVVPPKEPADISAPRASSSNTHYGSVPVVEERPVGETAPQNSCFRRIRLWLVPHEKEEAQKLLAPTAQQAQENIEAEQQVDAEIAASIASHPTHQRCCLI